MASSALTVWEDNSPERLFILAAKCVLANAQVLFRIVYDQDVQDDMCDDLFKHRPSFDQVHEGLLLPSEVCQHLLQTMISEGLDVDDRVAKAFGNPDRTRLRKLELRNSNLTNHGFSILAKHKFRELRLFNCIYLTDDSLLDLNNHSDNLVELTVDPANGMFPAYLGPFDEDDEDDDDDDMYEEEKIKAMKYLEKGYIIHAPKLKILNLRELDINLGKNYFEFLLKPLPQLTHLDLSGARHQEREGLANFEWLYCLKNLVSLVLHAVPGINIVALSQISKIKSLRHLDISQVKRQGHYENPNEILRNLVQSLENLSSLDISGTNLAGTSSYEAQEGQTVVKCDIPGLVSRVNRPLDFLGLYKTEHEASLRAHIPAIEVSGEINEEHLLSAARRYLHRSDVLESVLIAISEKIRVDDIKNHKNTMAMLDITLLAMERYADIKKFQMYCTITLYYLVRGLLNDYINIRVKQKIISTLLNVMYGHRHDTTIVRNGCLTICQFQLPHDVKFEYEKLVKILLFIVSEHNSDEGLFVQRAGICLLNSLAVQVDGPQKLLVGNLGAMEKMLEVIKFKLNLDICDEVMETAWSTMWNITDETPVNCKRFLDRGGMELFLQCKERFYEHNDLLRNMMGLLGNVAEVKDLRPHLMTTEFVSEFLLLVDSTSDGIETSYNAAGVLAHLASDGKEAWTIAEPTREEVLAKMVEALNRWDIETRRNINYRSFEPILRLVMVTHTPQCQHWAVWALANLTRTDTKYCRLIENEGGLELLEELINSNTSPAPYARILELASIVRGNVNDWRRSMTNQDNMEDLLEFDG